MPNPTWPSTLPAPEYGLSEQEVDGMIIRSNNEAGVAKQRLRYTAVAIPVVGQISMSRAQYATFRTFVKDTLKYVLPFDWTDFMTDSGTVTYRFTKKYTATRTGFDEITVGVAMERLP